MNIRTKMFVFIPLLVVLVSAVTFYIYQSSRTIQESYNLMMKRILLYKQIAQQTQQNLYTLNSYLIDQDQLTYNDLIRQKGQLEDLKDNLAYHTRTEVNLASIDNYGHMLETYLEKQHIIDAAYVHSLQDYTAMYVEIEKIAGFIESQGQHLVDLELKIYEPYFNEILKNTQRMDSIGLALFLVSMSMSIVFVIWLSRSITGPIRALVLSAKQISRRNLHISLPTFRKDGEFGILSATLQQMIVNIRELVVKEMENLQMERSIKELELKALQSQINPHFLFNTLNVLSRLALIEGAEKTSNLTISMSNLLRYNLRKLDKPVTLREEVDNTKEYFSIQQARFRERIRFEMDIDESALDQQIPCLSLQPIVENAFVHGVEEMEEGAVVRLSIVRIGGRVEVAIEDNGVGMTEEVRRSLLDYEDTESLRPQEHKSTGLGLQNVFKRLQLFYACARIVELISRPGEGTTVRLRLPIKEEGA